MRGRFGSDDASFSEGCVRLSMIIVKACLINGSEMKVEERLRLSVAAQ